MLIAVYGTLKAGRSNHSLMGGAEFQGKTKLVGFEMFSNGGFPVIYPTSDKQEIVVEVYEVEEENQLARIDRLEGHPHWYVRQQVDSEFGKVWVYVMQDPRYKESWAKIESGEF